MSIFAIADRASALPRPASDALARSAKWGVAMRLVTMACLFLGVLADGRAEQSFLEVKSMQDSRHHFWLRPAIGEEGVEVDAYDALGAASQWRDIDQAPQPKAEAQIIPAEFAQTANEEQIPRPLLLDPDNAPGRGPSFLEGEDTARPRPSFLDTDDSSLSVTQQLERLNQRMNDFESLRRAQEDATRSIIRQSFAEKGANINDFVVFGGTLEVDTFWATDFDEIAESDIQLGTAELDFEITVNSWSVGSLIVEYFDGQNFLFPTSEGDEVAVDRVTVRQAIITVGDTTRYPLFGTFGRAVIPFGISTGDPVADVLTIVDPLTVEVFETHEDFILIGFEWPTPPPPPPLSPGAAPAPLPPQPLLINPLVRRMTTSLCSYCGPPITPPTPPPAVPPVCVSPFSGAIYFYNGNTIDGIDEEDHIDHMGGTLGWRTKGTTRRGIPWSIDCDVDVNSSVFDSDFLQFEYRAFLDQIGYVPGMAAHAKSNYGPYSVVVEWNGAIANAEFVDDTGAFYSIQPQAWQIGIGYQFDWNPSVEFIGAQGTYLAIGYSESSDLAGVTRLIGGDPLAIPPIPATPVRVGFVPEKRFSIGFGEWVLPGLRVAFEYSYALDYDEDEGGTGNSAHGFFNQITYEW